MFNWRSWLRNNIKHGHKLKNKQCRKAVRMMLGKGKWEILPKKFFIIPDDGT